MQQEKNKERKQKFQNKAARQLETWNHNTLMYEQTDK